MSTIVDSQNAIEVLRFHLLCTVELAGILIKTQPTMARGIAKGVHEAGVLSEAIVILEKYIAHEKLADKVIEEQDDADTMLDRTKT